MCRRLVFLVFLASVSCLAGVANAELLVEYTFDGDLSDSSGSNRDGIAVGNPIVSGGQLQLDGSSFVDIPLADANPFDGSKDFTIEMSFKTSRPGILISSARYATPVNHSMSIFISDGRDELLPRGCLVYDNWYVGWVLTSNTSWADGAWHHLVVTHAASDHTVNVLVDGTVRGSGFVDPAIPNIFEDTVLIGGSMNPEWPMETCNNFIGLIDNVRIYNHALNQGEVTANYFCAVKDAEIAEHSEKLLRKAHEKLGEFGSWRTNSIVTTEHADEIASALMLMARVKEAKGHPIKEILDEYYDVAEQFPDSPPAIKALCKIVILGEEKGLAYANKFLEKDITGAKAAQLYVRLIEKYVAESDYMKADKYIKFFIDKYILPKGDLRSVDQLMSSGVLTNSQKQLYDTIIERSVFEDPDSEISNAIFRCVVLEFSRAKNYDQLLELARGIQTKFPETKLAVTATAVLVDEQYRLGNYVFALLAFKPELFTQQRPEAEIVSNIDMAVAVYRANTLRVQGVDAGKIYKALADYNFNLGRNEVAVHCYKQSAKAKGLGLEVFQAAAPKATNYCNSTQDAEIWFWRGLFAACNDDLNIGAVMYERFLNQDDTSILAARAYYDVARARMASGKYSEAKDAITRAKKISPCKPVIELESELNDAANLSKG